VSTHAARSPLPERESHASAALAVTSIMLGILVAVVGFFALFAWLDAHHARDAADRAAARAASAPASVISSSGALTSYAGAAPANADALASAHKPFAAELPAAPAGPVAHVNLVLKDVTVQIAPGVKYTAWAWSSGAPGPVIHVRQGQLVKITLTNRGAIPHSVDFHAARVAPNVAFGDVMPG
jgi:nitrite reductase (NO-forming)